MSRVQAPKSLSNPSVFACAEIWFAKVLSDLSGNLATQRYECILLAALDNARVGISRMKKDARLRPVPQTLDGFDVNFRSKSEAIFTRLNGIVPDTGQWTGAFMPAWLPSFDWDHVMTICHQVREALDSCTHPSPKPVFMAIAETELAATRLLRAASPNQFVIAPRLWDRLNHEQRQRAEKLMMHTVDMKQSKDTIALAIGESQLADQACPAT